MQYERLTDKDMTLNLNINPQQDMTRHFLFVQRLWELENQIEKGEWVKFPCKIGDTVWVVFLDDDNEYKIQESKCIGFAFNNDLSIRIVTGFSIYECYRKGNYLLKEEAEQRLKELQNNF